MMTFNNFCANMKIFNFIFQQTFLKSRCTYILHIPDLKCLGLKVF